MQLNVHNLQGETTGDAEVTDTIFRAEIRPHLFWEVVRWQQAKRRAGTHRAKNRHAVVGSTRKIYRQKGTGRARHGDIKAPIFVGGGVAHGPSPKDYSYKLNKKVRSGALRSALSLRASEGQLLVVEDFELPEIKTKRALAALEGLGAENALIVDGDNEVLKLSVRNLADHKYLHVAGLNVYDVLNHETLILTREALDVIEGRLAR